MKNSIEAPRKTVSSKAILRNNLTLITRFQQLNGFKYCCVPLKFYLNISHLFTHR